MERQAGNLLTELSGLLFYNLRWKRVFCCCFLLVFKTHFPENMLFGFKKKQKSLLLLLNYFIKLKMFSRFKPRHLHLF